MIKKLLNLILVPLPNVSFHNWIGNQLNQN